MSTDLRDLYQELILDHSRSPRNFGKLEKANCVQEGFNPLCGDKIIVYFRCADNQVLEAQFEGCGCAISMASGSLMMEALKDKTYPEIGALFEDFHTLVTQGVSAQLNYLGKLNVLAGVAAFPMRVKCATLPWHTALAALNIETKSRGTL